MSYAEVVNNLELAIRRYKDATHHVSCIVDINILKEAFDTIKEQGAEIERLNIELQAMRNTANSYKMHYETAKSEAIKEFAEEFAKALSEFDMSSVGFPDYDRGYKDCMTAIEDTIDSIVKK